MFRSELYFGLSQKNGDAVSPEAWQQFVDQEITPRFPEGFTILDADGQWRDSEGRIVHEASKIVLILHDKSSIITAKLDEIREIYRTKFNQEVVIRESARTLVSF